MIVEKQFLNRLKDFGLNSYEAKLWTALLSRGVASAGELSDISNVPRSRTYDVLESLERKGFIIMKLGKPIKYIAVTPAEVTERVKKNVQQEAAQQEEQLSQLQESDVLRDLITLHKQGLDVVDPADLTGVVKGRQNIISHLQSLIKNAEKSISIMTTSNGLNNKLALTSALSKAKDRGVSVRILAPSSKNPDAAKVLAAACSLRNTKQPVSRFCIVDGKNVTLMALDDAHPNYDFGIWVSTESFAKGFQNVFETAWDAAA